jgi:tetratricopeptide (TPR) repeat protein
LTRGGRAGALTLALAAVLLSSCAKPQAAPPHPPESGEYLFPSWPAGELRPDQERRIHTAWRSLLAGDATAAERELQKALQRDPGLVPAATALAYARLAQGRIAEAGRGFEEVLRRRTDYVPAVAGAAQAAQRAGDSEAALRLYGRAQSLAPEDPLLRRRLAEVRLQVTEKRVADARGAIQAGRVDEAVAQYRAALEAAPELAGLRLELATLLADRGEKAEAVSVLEGDPSQDRQALLHLAQLLEEMKEHDRALEAYRRLLARDPHDEEALRRSQEVRQALELQQMPEEYRAIAAAPRISRAELAALLAVKVTALSRIPAGPPRVAIDISGSWARDHILKALGLDLMDVYPNHTFQPGATVRRGELARAVARVLDLLKWPSAPTPALADMTAGNLFYNAAARVVAAGLMDLSPAGAFEAWRPVSGQEAVDVIEGLIRLVGP